MFGYSPEEVEGVDLDRLVGVEPDLADLASELSRTVLRGEDSVVESTRSRKDGSRFPVLIRGVPIRQEGKVAAVYAIYEDITVRKKAEADLRRERAHFERIMLDSPDGIVVFNRDGMVMKANPAFERLFGRKSYTDWLDRSIPNEERVKAFVRVWESSTLSFLGSTSKVTKSFRLEGTLTKAFSVRT